MSLLVSKETDFDELLDTDVSALLSGGAEDIQFIKLRCIFMTKGKINK